MVPSWLVTQAPRTESESFALPRWSIRRVAQTWPRTTASLWVALSLLAVLVLQRREDLFAGGTDGLVPRLDRPPQHELLVLLRLRDAGERFGGTDAVLEAAATLADNLGEARVPFVPDAGEAEAWVDRYRLYLLPETALGELELRLTDESIVDAVGALRARMSSPLFGVSGEDPRRDPLGLADLMRQGFSESRQVATLAGTRATARGDLATLDGTRVLMQLRTDRPAAEVLADVRSQLHGAPVEACLVGPVYVESEARRLVRGYIGRLATTVVVALLVVVTLALRRLRAPAAIMLCLVSGIGIAMTWLPHLDVWALPMLVLAAGYCPEGAFHLQRIGVRGWPTAAVLATALAPLALSPYPQWQSWAWLWGVVVLTVLAVLRWVLPAMYVLIGGAVTWRRRGFMWRALPGPATWVAVGALGAGAWGMGVVGYRGVDRPALGLDANGDAHSTLLTDFFDPTLEAWHDSEGPDAITALIQASADAQALEGLVPSEARMVDSPGRFIRSDQELAQRKMSLVQLVLAGRLEQLRTRLETQGFRADAFGEFLHSGQDVGVVPSASALLNAPLRGWLRRYVSEHDGTVSVRSYVHLPPGNHHESPRAVTSDGRVLELHGPAVAARRERSGFADWVGIYCLCQLWIGALIVWLGTRSLAIAVSAASAALVTQCATLAMMAMLRIPLGPALLPVILLVGAGAVIAASRACRAIDLNRPLFAMGVIVTSLCQIAAACALWAAPVPVWREMAMVVGIGAAVASGAGLFVAPGLCRTLRKAFGALPETPSPPGAAP